MSTQLPDIKYLFEPRSVAVIGVSQEPGKIGYKILENMIEVGYQGRIYPVNPKGGRALGLEILKSVDDIDDEIDVLVGSLTSVLEPFLIVFMGLMVGFIVIAMFMPLFTLTQVMSQ
jgi:acyl-CoA synthetase (NDP forming)